MAKDKEKLFRGVDDKAITFQRAVFIVCNLKRLIKRPKKEGDKYIGLGGSSSNRKRSGESSFYGSSNANQNDEQDYDYEEPESSSGLRFGPGARGAHLRASKIRDPVRRAFTLPTMLCQSFVGVAPANLGRQLDVEPLEGQADEQRQDDNDDSYANHRPLATPTGSIQVANSRQVSPVSCNNWPSTGQAKFSCSSCNETPTSQGNHQNNHRHLNSNSNNHNSISCLATPIRRSAASVGPLGERHKTSEELTSRTEARLLDGLATQRPSLAGCAASVMEPGMGHSTSGQQDAFGVAAATTMTTSKIAGHHQQQLWCPVWALAMDILDARQSQPREQQAHAQQLVGAPSPAPFLLGPRRQPETRTKNGAPVEAAAQDEQDDNNELSDDQEEDKEKDDDDDQDKTTTTSTTSPHSAKTSAKRNVKSHKKRANELESFQQIPMKRFSSALCLNNHELLAARSQAAGARLHQATSKGGQPVEQQQGSKLDDSDSSTGAAAAAKTKRSAHSKQAARSRTSQVCLLNPADADPAIALARNRRPSVTNQNSVNVDQQALFSAVECNQLERARAILEDGKANVNSLNGDKLTCLDVAVLMRNVDMARLLQHYNAKESSAFLTAEGRENQLYSLYLEARRLVQDLANSLEAIQVPQASGATTTTTCSSTSVNNNNNSPITSQLQQQPPPPQQPQTSSSKELQQTGNLALLGASSLSTTGATSASISAATAAAAAATSNTITSQQPQHQQLMLATGSLLSSALLEEKQRQLQYWRRRLDLFMHMRYEFERLEVPNAPELAVLQVVGESSLGIKIIHSNRHCRRSSLAAPTTTCDESQPQTRPQLDQLGRAAQLNNLRCSQGPRCSHWRLDEFHQSMPSASQCLESSTGGGGGELRQSSNGKQEQMKRQQRLAVFNHLLAQQLTLLSQQQQQPAPTLDELLASGKPQGGRPQSLRFYAGHHSESTDTACDYFRSSNGDPLDSTLGQLEQKLNDHRTATAQLACHSLAYQLMTTKRQVALPLRPAQQQHHHHHQNQTDHAQEGYAATTSASNKQQVVIITKYKVEWSLNEQMDNILGSMIIYNTNLYPLECKIEKLTNGQTYYVQVSAGNLKGFSEPIRTTPVCLAPSSWRQVEGNKADRRRSKYDEQVFKKFTKLILLNKHILVSSDFATDGQQHQQAGSPNSNQNKSTLINMLLLDATMPTTSEQLRQARLGGSGGEAERIGRSDLGEVDLLGSPIKTIGSTASTASKEQQQQQTSQLRVRKNLKNFFQSNSAKFHKLNNQNKRGLYLATVIYHSQARLAGSNQQGEPSSSSNKKKPNKTNPSEPAKNSNSSNNNTKTANSSSNLIHQIDPNSDKIVVSNDDRLPIIEVINDLVSPSALMGDFYWLLKINGTRWIDIKRLRQELQKSHSSSTLHLRIKLLQAIEQMQLALNLEDLGRLFYRPIQAHDGSIIICTCRHVDSLKSVSNLSIKWTQFGKIIPRHLRKISEAIQVTSQQQQQHQNQQLLSSSRDQQQRNPSWSSTSSRKSSSWMQDQPGTPVSSPGGETNSSEQTDTTEHQSTPTNNQTGGQQQQQAPPTPSRNGLEAGGLRLCEHCQQGLSGRRCTMASGSSSSSINSNESQWSSQSGSITTTGRQCTCSRSNSASIQATQAVQSSSDCKQQQQQSLAIGSHPNWPASGSHAGQMQMAASAPASKRNSAASARSGSVMSNFGASTGQSSGSVHGASFSVHPSSYHHQHHLSSSADIGSGRLGSHSQSQQLMAAPQKSSTYLMLASLSLYDLLLYNLKEIIHFDQASVLPLNRGLYLGFVQLQTTVESMRLLVPRARPNMIPNARIRDNAHVSREEWQLLKRFASNQQQQQAGQQGSPATSAGGRSSDPSIWSLATQPRPDTHHGQQARKSVQAANNNLSTPDRNRAKSVSPGLIKDTRLELERRQAVREATQTGPSTATCSARADGLSISSDQIVTMVPEKVSKTTNNGAHSDTDLTTTLTSPDQSTSRRLQVINSSSSQQQLDGQTGQEADDEEVVPVEVEEKDSDQRRLCVSKQLTCSMASLAQTPEETFVRLVGSAAKRLLNELRCQLPKVYDEQTDSLVSILASLNDEQLNRIYHLELIELGNEVTFILLIPAPENVCPVTSHERSNILADNRDYMLLPLQIFETIHISTYEPDLLGKYSRLSAILETDLIVAQHEHRQAFSSNELKSTKSRVNQLQDMVSIADEFWRQLRWIVDVVSFARDKLQANNGIRLGSIWSYFELSPSLTVDSQLNAQVCPLSRPANQTPAVAAFRRQTSNEVKRTSSVQVPQIQLTQTPSPPSSSVVSVVLNDQYSSGATSGGGSAGGRQTCPSKQQLHRQASGRRHSDEGTSSGHFQRRANPQVVVVDAAEQVEARCEPASNGSIFQVELNFDEDNDDDQAIYAYHISLRDATRAAAQRKSSQQSVAVCIDNHENRRMLEDIKNVEPQVSEANERSEQQQQQQQQVEPTTSRSPNMRHLKSTNPFLSDSFEQAEAPR